MITCSVIVPSSPILKKDLMDSELLTEALFGETLEVIETFEKFSYIRILNDNYLGWINSNHISTLIYTTHRIINFRTLVYSNTNIKAKYICYLSMGSLVEVIQIHNEWAEIRLYENFKNISAYILTKDIVPKNDKQADWVKYAEKLINTPYKWGGKDTIGIDCSALVQLSTQTGGIKFPRDTSEQMNFPQKLEIGLESCNRGSLVYWKGHVGIFINENFIIHANGYHMSTVIESFNKANKRIERIYGNVIKFFNILT